MSPDVLVADWTLPNLPYYQPWKNFQVQISTLFTKEEAIVSIIVKMMPVI